MTAPRFDQLLQAAADQYADAKVAAATAQIQQQLAEVQAQLAATQAQLANALAAEAADTTLITQLQASVAGLQAQLALLSPGKAPAPPAGWAVVFQDDFTTPQLDGGKWSATTDAASNELSQRLPANVLAGAGYLTIRAQLRLSGVHLRLRHDRRQVRRSVRPVADPGTMGRLVRPLASPVAAR